MYNTKVESSPVDVSSQAQTMHSYLAVTNEASRTSDAAHAGSSDFGTPWQMEEVFGWLVGFVFFLVVLFEGFPFSKGLPFLFGFGWVRFGLVWFVERRGKLMMGGDGG